MSTLHANLYALSIPFTMTFSHSRASRSECDSMVLRITDGSIDGFGELVLREYVNDLEGVFRGHEDIAGRMKEIVRLVTGSDPAAMSVDGLRAVVLDPDWAPQDLPLLAAVEGAVLDFLCKKENVDIYTLLDRRPLREEILYGAVMPIIQRDSMKKMLHAYRQIGMNNLRIKLSGDREQNNTALSLARDMLGSDFDIRVDVNCGWDVEEAVEQLDLLEDFGIRLVEEPLGPDREGMRSLAERSKDYAIVYVADESAVTFEDLDFIIGQKTFGMLNLRLAKNGGLLRVLELSERADHADLRYQLGCHVGETGILSMTGRAAAALIARPEYVDGSFDGHLLSDNVTKEHYTFGKGGVAPVIRQNGMGYEVVLSKMEKNSTKKFFLV